MAKALAKGTRITGAPRATLASQLAKRYGAGESIRKISEDTGRSFGFIHGVLKESGVALRGRGGATRGAKKAPSAAGTAKKPTAKATTTKTAAKKTAAARATKSGSKTAPIKTASKRAAVNKG